VKICQVYAFTNEPFKGNPAAVCLMSGHVDEGWMKNVAKEMNLTETAFLLKQENGFNLRWFTPKVKVDLCSHATLASAHVLWKEGMVSQEGEIRFYTKSGLLKAVKKGDWIELDFPAEPEEEADTPPGFEEALGVIPKYVGKNRLNYLVEVYSEETLRELSPDLVKLKAIQSRGFIVTSTSASQEYDFVSRVFAPRVGIDKDPVTGSAYCSASALFGKNGLAIKSLQPTRHPLAAVLCVFAPERQPCLAQWTSGCGVSGSGFGLGPAYK